ncbi:MAG: alpha/beta fold hydrolase [Blastocatellia bacterium]|nr:alpha/beta fold hydrolase [Blastocatellia bacterium]
MSKKDLGNFVTVESLRLHYLEVGSGDPVLLLHGWPTSSFLWRNIITEIGKKNRVIAIDLPGFGLSDKPTDISYSFRFYNRILDGFLQALKIDKLALAVHDLGGPVGLHWACNNPDRVTKLALLNTLVYPELSWAAVAFVVGCRLPLVSSFLSSQPGLKLAMRIGLSDSNFLTDEVVKAVQAPFQDAGSRQALLKAGYGLNPKGLQEIAEKLPNLKIPIQIIYGERDRILPDIAKTMKRVQKDLPQAKVEVLKDCGHFLQEERPKEIGSLLAKFFAEKS